MAQKISQMNPVVTPALTDKLEDAQVSATQSLALTLQQILTLFNKQGESINKLVATSYQAALTDNGGTIVFPSGGIIAMTVTLPTNAVDNTLPLGYSVLVVNPSGNTENVTISYSTDTLLGTSTILPGSAALIVKTVYGATNTWEVFYSSQSLPIPIALGGTNASNISSACANLGALQVSNNLSDVQSLATTQANLRITGLQTPPLWFQPTNSSGCTAGQASFAAGVNVPYLQFADAVTSYSYVMALLPKRWNQSTFQLLASWYTPATTGTVIFKADAAITQLSTSLNLTFGTAVTTSSPCSGVANGPTNVLTGAITPSGVATDNSWIVIRLYRDGGNGSDTLADNALVINPVEIRWTASAGNDA